MTSIPCTNGRMQAIHLTAMNLRAVLGTDEVTYVSSPKRKHTTVEQVVRSRFQPRDDAGRFVSYADLWEAIHLEYAWTAYEYDVEDEARVEAEATDEEL